MTWIRSIKEKENNFLSILEESIKRGLKTGSNDCHTFVCSPAKTLHNSFNSQQIPKTPKKFPELPIFYWNRLAKGREGRLLEPDARDGEVVPSDFLLSDFGPVDLDNCPLDMLDHLDMQRLAIC